MVASPYLPKDGSQNYLHIQVPAGQQSIGDRPGFNLNSKISSSQKELDFTYLVSGQYANIATAMHTSQWIGQIK